MKQIGQNISFAQQLLEAGEVIGIPTETVYGLAANAYNPVAVEKIFDIKSRPYNHPLIIHIASKAQLSTLITELPSAAEKLAQHSWPGPLTLLLPKRCTLASIATGNNPTVAVRIPNHPITLSLLQQLSFPLAAPSANPFGYVSPTQALHVYEQLGNKVPYILEGGPCQVGIESTIVGFEGDRPVIYRLGGLTIEKIVAITGLIPSLYIQQKATKSLPSPTPGLSIQHYAPLKPLYLGSIAALVAANRPARVGILAFNQYYKDVAKEHQVLLAPHGTLEEVAQRLYAGLRTLDQLPIDCIICNYLPPSGLGSAINERLQRASQTIGNNITQAAL
jgi:L-threonylcarbamoyladenylate synthase